MTYPEPSCGMCLLMSPRDLRVDVDVCSFVHVICIVFVLNGRLRQSNHSQ